jgi:hypothetical protein
LELLQSLESAWWRGEIVGEASVSRLELIRHLFKSTHDFGVVFVVGDQPGPPEITESPDGNADLDRRPRVKVPSSDMQTWNDTNCGLAYQSLVQDPVLVKDPVLVEDPVIGPVLCGIKLRRAAFMQWLSLRGYALPTFWGTIETNHDATRSAQENGARQSTLPTTEPIAAPPQKRGRPTGTGLALLDEPLLAEMESLIKKGKSAYYAAGLVAERAEGFGTLESKQTRLRKAYREKNGIGE